MDPTELFTSIAAFLGVVITVPLVIQWVNQVSQRLHAGHLQAQVNDNTALNNTSIQGTAGSEEVAKTAKNT